MFFETTVQPHIKYGIIIKFFVLETSQRKEEKE